MAPQLRPRVSQRAIDELRRVVGWYFDRQYGMTEGLGTTPFYCDPGRVGAFAVSERKLAQGTESATFRLFVTLAMYQALRDVVIMRRQRRLARGEVEAVAGLSSVRRFRKSGRCPGLAEAASVSTYCDVWKRSGRIDCGKHPGIRCSVKCATRTFGRMGDLGKLPASAFEIGWSKGGLRTLLHRTIRAEPSPARRAQLLVAELERVHRVGRKLATMYVSALSTPALAPSVSPWFPQVDGNALVVVDTNVARAVDLLRAEGPRTYGARESWVQRAALEIDLRRYHRGVPSYSPRLIQQALYRFCSKSNRISSRDACPNAEIQRRCGLLCPFCASG